jgi:ubiquinone/menaquinone biosynthesis C-methylase UbiE
MNSTKDVNNLYINKDTLSTRICLHNKYSVNKFGWNNWVFDKYNLDEDIKILELGCGIGSIWLGKQLPKKIDIILTDISPIMLEKAEANLRSNNRFSFQIVDIQNIPFSDKYFDIIIANHMLYHVPDLDKGLSEIKRTLKTDGYFYTSTTGNNNLKELQDIYRIYEDKVKFNYSNEISFTLENGEQILKKYFRNIDQKYYIDSLEVTDTDDLMNYIVSYNEIPKEIYDEIYKTIENIINKNGKFNIKKDSGMFICNI